MSRTRNAAIGDLLNGAPASLAAEALGDGAVMLRGFVAAEAPAIMAAVRAIVATAPFRHMITPGGYRMSVAMTSCGRVGWITDRSGYRYTPVDPDTELTWPPMPDLFRTLAGRAAAAGGFIRFVPDSCLINRYDPGARLSLHQDKDEQDLDAPVVSVALGLPATFLFGGSERRGRPRRIRMESGDVAVWGGATRLAFHGIDTLADGEHALTGRCRINLTFRKAL